MAISTSYFLLKDGSQVPKSSITTIYSKLEKEYQKVENTKALHRKVKDPLVDLIDKCESVKFKFDLRKIFNYQTNILKELTSMFSSDGLCSDEIKQIVLMCLQKTDKGVILVDPLVPEASN